MATNDQFIGAKPKLMHGFMRALLKALRLVKQNREVAMGAMMKFSELTLGSDQAKPLLFQGLSATERCYLALEPHFPYRNDRHKAAPALEEYTNRLPRQPGDVVL